MRQNIKIVAFKILRKTH